MNSLSIIIPSRNEANLRACAAAIRAAGETCRIIVVWDGECDSRQTPQDLADWWCTGIKPFIFACNVNIGIRAAGADDVILCNDDALLQTPMGFTAMQRAGADYPNIGLVSATTNVAGNIQQNPMRGMNGMRICKLTPGNSFPTVAFVCVFIPRETIDEIGLLDERFTAYGWEDNDYCRRMHVQGLKVGIFDGCYVDHSKLQSTFRTSAYAAGDINAGREIYLKKWGSM